MVVVGQQEHLDEDQGLLLEIHDVFPKEVTVQAYTRSKKCHGPSPGARGRARPI